MTPSTNHQINAGHNERYDIIFVGGGATSCVTAGRIAEACSALKILILEAGPHTRELEEHIQPARFFRRLIHPGRTFTRHFAKPSDALAGRSVTVLNGRCLGGGASINFTTYTRAAASDYDEWETVHGNTGWGSKDLIPLLKRAETYQEKATNDTHGTHGPLKISLARDEINLAENYLEVTTAYDTSRKRTDDINSFFSCNEYGRWPRYIDTNTGRRSDPPHYYIYNQDGNPNLTIMAQKRVIRIISEGGCAVGVEYIDDLKRQEGVIQNRFIAYASRLVVLSAGAFGSPAILERSGIGRKDILQKNSVEQIVDLPGVGEHYKDHNHLFAPYLASNDADTLDTLFRGTEAELEPYVSQWYDEGKGLMAHNAFDAGIKIRPTFEELESLGPHFRKRWITCFANTPDKPAVLTGIFAAYGGRHPDATRRKYFTMVHISTYPSSVGRVHISSGTDPHKPLDFEPGYLNEPGDVEVLRWAYKISREIARRLKFYRGEFSPEHPKFSRESQAHTGVEDGPVDLSTPDIVYSCEDDEAIDNYIRQTAGTGSHSMGTCAMKARESGGVVDERLNVYGIKNLKIADCSICPGNVGANTYNTALAIGEKAALIIIEDLGIS